MLRIEPTKKVSFAGIKNDNKLDELHPIQKNFGKKPIIAALSGMAVLGLAAIGLKKTSKMSFEEALKKSGVEIKDGVATLAKSGERFSGKIERFEKRNRKEVVEFIDGIMTEKLYYTALGKEIEGYFYKGEACYKSSRYKDFLLIGNKDTGLKIDGMRRKGPFFEETRKHVASPAFDKSVQECKKTMSNTSCK